MRTVVALLLLLLVPAALPLAQGQAEYVNVTLRFGAGTDTEENLQCDVRVPLGANGITVVMTAHLLACIHQYDLDGSTGNTRVVCLDDVCNFGAVSWQQYHNGTWVYPRLESFVAYEGAVLGLAYANSPPSGLPDPGSYTAAFERFLPPDGVVFYTVDSDNDGFPNEVWVWTFYGGNADPNTWYAAYDLKWDVDDGRVRDPLDTTKYRDVPPLDPL